MSSSASPSSSSPINLLHPRKPLQPLADPNAMPAQRTRATKHAAKPKGEERKRKRSDSEEPAIPMGIAFAPTVTPGTYFDPPSPQDPSTPAESLLFPDPDEREESPAPSRRGGHGKKKPEDHIPRPPNAFILFRSAFIKNQHVSSDVETNHSTLSKIIGLTWQGLSRDEKAVWHNKAKLALQEHKRKFPGYTFRPLHTKGKSAEKRKVREVGPKDQKRCQKIADLLNDGLKGAELEAAIAEFDRHHVPEIITRFEAPITARSFRRSSSAPLPEGLLLSAKASGKQKARAMSSQPEISAKGKSRQTPAKKTQRDLQPDFDASESEESYCATPSSPYPTTPFPDTNPSFDFSSFSFDTPTASPTQMQHCDPLTVTVTLPPLQTTFDAPYMFSPEPSPLICTPEHDVFSPLQVSFHQQPHAYYDQWASPLSSVPPTPSDAAPSMYFSASASAPSPACYEPPHFDFFEAAPQVHVYDHASAYQQLPLEHLAHEYAALHAKPAYTCYDRQGLAPFAAGSSGLSPPYTPGVPTYAM